MKAKGDRVVVRKTTELVKGLIITQKNDAKYKITTVIESVGSTVPEDLGLKAGMKVILTNGIALQGVEEIEVVKNGDTVTFADVRGIVDAYSIIGEPTPREELEAEKTAAKQARMESTETEATKN